MALSRYSCHIQGLRHFPCRQQDLSLTALAYDFTRHEHYKHLSLCEHGLSSTIRYTLIAAITRTLLMITKIIICNFRMNSNGFQLENEKNFVNRTIYFQIHAFLNWITVLEYQNLLSRQFVRPDV